MPTEKHELFVSGPMENKSVKKMPGIGRVLGEQMEAGGITYAYEVFGQFLVLKKDKAAFCNWLRTFGADNGQCNDCYYAIIEWSVHFFE